MWSLYALLPLLLTITSHAVRINFNSLSRDFHVAAEVPNNTEPRAFSHGMAVSLVDTEPRGSAQIGLQSARGMRSTARILWIFWALAVASYGALASAVFIFARRWFGQEAPAKKTEESTIQIAEPLDSSSGESDEEGRGMEETNVQGLDTSSMIGESRFSMKSTLHTKAQIAGEHKRLKEKGRRRAYKAQWLWESHDKLVKDGAITLLGVTIMMIFYRLMRLMKRPHQLPWSPYLIVVEFPLLFCVLGGAIYCVNNPSQYTYWPLFAFFNFYIPAATLPPFQWSCADLEYAEAAAHEWYLNEAKANMDCTLQGLTAQELFMASILMLPWLVPRQKMLKTFGFLWILGVYLPWTYMYSELTGEKILGLGEHVLRLLILGITFVIAWVKSFYTEKNARNNFVMVFRRRQAGKKMYHILSYMLPNHVIVPMLADPDKVIAEHIPKVSILFIVIADFDEFARRCTPEELLKFLNDQFTQFDLLCAEHGVTKIETVGEEYVACVGAVPEEKAMEHKDILKRLFAVADRILKLQATCSKTPQVKFKMGLHTGPIVAGVIGKKLPRYRLFGDTINTAARMMQKSTVGRLQFGEETFKELPEAVQYEDRGDIEMKGKGLVKTYFFKQLGHKRDTTTPKSVRAPRKTLCDLLHEKDLDLTDEVVESASAAAGGADEETPHAGEEFGTMSGVTAASDTVLSSQPRTTVQRERKDFEDVLKQVTMKEFTDEMEREWYNHYHEKIICKKFAGRLHRILLCLLLITVVECTYMICEKAWHYSHNWFPGHLRLPIFLILRGLAVMICLFGRFVVAPKEWHRNAPFLVQSGLVVSTTIILLLIWFSYEALTTTQNSMRQVTKVKRASNTYEAPFDQVFVLNFVLVFYAVSGLQHFLFRPSLIFVGLAIFLWKVSDDRGEEGLTFPFMGKALFVTIALSNSFHAYQAQKSSRERFKAWREVQEFKVRIENILNTLMPRQVVKELKTSPHGAPPPSHQYSKMTIAQSDLCGFTKLASTKTPQEVVALIGDLFGAFDMLTDKHDVYKVETVGDAYIAGQAEHTLTSNKSPISVILFGMDMVNAVDEWAVLKQVAVRCRVGIHHGACIGGIVGNDMQRYHLFGDLMSGVEVLESTAPEGEVQVSSACKLAIEEHLSAQSFQLESKEPQTSAFVFEVRTQPNLKTSKGEVHSYDEVGGHTYIVKLGASNELMKW